MIFPTHNVAITFGLLILVPVSIGSRLSSCMKWSVRFGWLVATCPNDANPSVLVESSLLLNQIVSVDEQSHLIWSRNGGYHRSCEFVGVEDGILFGDCIVAGGNHTTVKTTLDLATYIDNYNGFLVSNFTKTPTVPAATSDVPVPVFFQIGMYLERANCSAPFQPLDFSAPVKCKPYDIVNDTGIENRGWSIALNDGYELSLWSTNGCTGEPLAKLGMKDTRKFCQVLPSRINSISLRPLFNADYDLSLAFGNPL